jgi:hypothetical protein
MTAMTKLNFHEQEKQLGSTVAEDISGPAERSGQSPGRATPCNTDLQATRNQGTVVVHQHQKLNKKHHLAPVAPKRQSEFMLFRQEALADLKAKFPGISWGERVESVSKQWAAMSKADRNVSNTLFWFEQFFERSSHLSELDV